MSRLRGIILSLFIFFFLIFGNTNVAFSAISLQQVVQKVRTAVVTVVTDKMTGTGFVIAPSGYVVTCQHVIAGFQRASIKDSSGNGRSANLLLQNERTDVALLEIQGGFGSPKLTLSKKLPALGEEIFVVGSPKGLEQTVSKGIVSSIRSAEGLNYIQIDASVSHGSSGSPVFNMQGEVVGIVQASFTDGQNLNFALASTSLLKLISGKSGTSGTEKLAPILPKIRTQEKESGIPKSSLLYFLLKDVIISKDIPGRDLEAYLDSNPDSAEGWFILGFHNFSFSVPNNVAQLLHPSMPHGPETKYYSLWNAKLYWERSKELGINGISIDWFLYKLSECYEVMEEAVRIEKNRVEALEKYKASNGDYALLKVAVLKRDEAGKAWGAALLKTKEISDLVTEKFWEELENIL